MKQKTRLLFAACTGIVLLSTLITSLDVAIAGGGTPGPLNMMHGKMPAPAERPFRFDPYVRGIKKIKIIPLDRPFDVSFYIQNDSDTDLRDIRYRIYAIKGIFLIFTGYKIADNLDVEVIDIIPRRYGIDLTRTIEIPSSQIGTSQTAIRICVTLYRRIHDRYGFRLGWRQINGRCVTDGPGSIMLSEAFGVDLEEIARQ